MWLWGESAPAWPVTCLLMEDLSPWPQKPGVGACMGFPQLLGLWRTCGIISATFFPPITICKNVGNGAKS